MYIPVSQVDEGGESGESYEPTAIGTLHWVGQLVQQRIPKVLCLKFTLDLNIIDVSVALKTIVKNDDRMTSRLRQNGDPNAQHVAESIENTRTGELQKGQA